MELNQIMLEMQATMAKMEELKKAAAEHQQKMIDNLTEGLALARWFEEEHAKMTGTKVRKQRAGAGGTRDAAQGFKLLVSKAVNTRQPTETLEQITERLNAVVAKHAAKKQIELPASISEFIQSKLAGIAVTLPKVPQPAAKKR